MPGVILRKWLIVAGLLLLGGELGLTQELLLYPKDELIGSLQLDVIKESALGQLVQALLNDKELSEGILFGQTQLVVRREYQELRKRVGKVERVRVSQWYEGDDHALVHLRIFAKKEQLEVIALFMENKERLVALSF